jgi:hypothetical protein
MTTADQPTPVTGPNMPSYHELPIEPGGARSGWGLFGPTDSAGLMNLITPEVTRAAAALVRTGERFALDVPTAFVNPPFFDRGVPRHTLIQRRPGRGFDDVYDNYFPQAASQWDSLAHVAARPGEFYNGATREEITAGERNTIEHWGSVGIATRGIVLDVSESVLARGGPGTSTRVRVSDLEEARERAEVQYRPGDILLVHTGFLTWYAEQAIDTRIRLSRREHTTAAGLERSEEMAAYIWNTHAVGVASDTLGLEVWGAQNENGPYGSLHRIFIGLFGLAIGELWWLADLVRGCHDTGRHEVFLTSSPGNHPGATGSEPHALAIL